MSTAQGSGSGSDSSGVSPEYDGFAAIRYGWSAFQKNIVPMVVVILAPLAAELVIAFVGKALIDSVARRFLFQIAGVVLSGVAGLGVRRMALMITAGEPTGARAAFRYDRWAEWIAFSVVFGLLESVGLVLCVIPGVLFLAYFGLAPFFFLDRGMSMGASLRASRAAVSSKGLAFSVLLAFIFGLLGIVVFFVGAFITEAMATLALAFLYRYATGQPVAAAA